MEATENYNGKMFNLATLQEWQEKQNTKELTIEEYEEIRKGDVSFEYHLLCLFSTFKRLKLPIMEAEVYGTTFHLYTTPNPTKAQIELITCVLYSAGFRTGNGMAYYNTKLHSEWRIVFQKLHKDTTVPQIC